MSLSIVMHGLRDQREELRLTQAALAKKAGVAPMTVFHAEKGLPVTFASHEKITAALESLRAEQEAE